MFAGRTIAADRTVLTVNGGGGRTSTAIAAAAATVQRRRQRAIARHRHLRIGWNEMHPDKKNYSTNHSKKFRKTLDPIFCFSVQTSDKD